MLNKYLPNLSERAEAKTEVEIFDWLFILSHHLFGEKGDSVYYVTKREHIGVEPRCVHSCVHIYALNYVLTLK